MIIVTLVTVNPVKDEHGSLIFKSDIIIPYCVSRQHFRQIRKYKLRGLRGGRLTERDSLPNCLTGLLRKPTPKSETLAFEPNENPIKPSQQDF